jgi:HD-GYP domain-containing protein (c-di-GMP phosphodiesterase class II)
MGVERTSLFLADEETRQLRSCIAQGAEHLDIVQPFGVGLVGAAAAYRKILVIPDAYADPRFDRSWDVKSGYRTRNVLCGPLVTHERRLVGVLQILNKIDGAFDDEDLSLFAAFSGFAAVAIENTSLYEERERLFQSLIHSLAAAVDARDPVTAGHAERVAGYARAIAVKMGLDEREVRALDYAATLHDVGKIGVRDEVLLKAGRFTDEERKLAESHVVHTREILGNVYFPRDLRDIPNIACAHHERLNGSGYPAGATGNATPRLAKILAVADVYDALVAFDRPYKKPWPSAEAIKLLENRELFDPEVVEALKKALTNG